jgi:RNA polymerase sigma-70 factor (ECF subfamily)
VPAEPEDKPQRPPGFEARLQEHAPRLRAFFRRRQSSESLAEELCQEVLLAAWRQRDRYDAERGSLSTWLFTIARNKHIDAVRKQARPRPDPDDPCFRQGHHPEAPDTTVQREQRSARLRAALGALGDEQRMTLQQLYFEGRTMAEVAQRQGVPLGTVKSRVRRGLQHLRQALAGGADEL